MKYKNIKTGAVVDSLSVVRGENWQLVEEKKVEEPKVTAKKPTRKPKE